MAEDISTPEVVIDLSGETFTLTPTLGAAVGINATFGGLYPAGQRAMSGDIAAIATIIRYGAGLDAKAEKDLVEKVFRAGVTAVSTKAMSFVGILINGGRAKKDDAEPGEANRDGPALH
jgi:hypothetical protein